MSKKHIINDKLNILFVCFIISFSYGIVNGSIDVHASKAYLLEGGWVEIVDGVTILHVSGTAYEMGYQHGFYLHNEIRENIAAMNYYCTQHGWNYEDVLEIWHIQQHYLPSVYIDEMQGMADALGITFEEVAVHNTWMGVFNHLFSCWGAALWGDATVDGNLIHMRSCDGVMGIMDPETGSYLYENQIIIIRDPDNAYASITPIFAGDILSIGGFNENGVGVSELTILGDDTTFHGINAGFRMRMVLDFADDAYEAVSIMNSNRTCCWNFIISDATIPVGFAIEQSANYVYTNAWFDSAESTEPFWQIKDVVRRGNCNIVPKMAEMNRKFYDPSGLKGYIRLLLGIEYTYSNWIQYKAISNEIESRYGSISVEGGLELLREVYQGKTNIMFRIIHTDKTETARQWAANLLTGDFEICFAENGIEAYQRPIHNFNFYELLNDKPPS